MTSELYYPEITPEVKKVLTLVPKLIQSNPNYLDSIDCPYEPEEVELLKRTFSSGAEEHLPKDAQFYTDQEIDLEKESVAMYWEIQNFKKQVDREDVSEKVQLFRLSTSLLEKLLVIKERAAGVSQFEEFQQLILDTLDRYLNPVQKSEFSTSMQDLFESKE